MSEESDSSEDHIEGTEFDPNMPDRPKHKFRIICGYCGSERVWQTAAVSWDYEDQKMKFDQLLDEQGDCEDCHRGDAIINVTETAQGLVYIYEPEPDWFFKESPFQLPTKSDVSSDEELYTLPEHLAAKPIATWTEDELRDQLDLYEAKKLRRSRRKTELSPEEIKAVTAMHHQKIDMMVELHRRLTDAAR